MDMISVGWTGVANLILMPFSASMTKKFTNLKQKGRPLRLNGMSTSKSILYVSMADSRTLSAHIFVQPSRVAAELTVELFDWNQIEQAKSLGVGRIDVAGIEPFQATEQNVKLSTNKRGEKGSIRVRLVFQPGIIAKSRKATSTLTSAGRAVTTIGGLPVSAGKGVFQGVAGVFKNREASIPDPISPTTPFPAIGSAEAAHGSTTSLPFVENAVVTAPEPGSLRVTVLNAKDLSHNDVKPYVTLRVGDREVKTKHTQKTHSPEW